MWLNSSINAHGHLLAAPVPVPNETTTATLSSPVAAWLIVLALYGVLNLFLKKPPAKPLVILVLAGILIVYVTSLLEIGQTVRGWIVDALVKLGITEAAGEFTFTLIVLLAIFAVGSWMSKGGPRTVLLIILSFVLFTLTWAQTIIIGIINASSSILGALSGLSF